MSEPKFSESELQSTLRESENHLDSTTLRALTNARKNALDSPTPWFGGFKGAFSAGIATTALIVAVLVPVLNNDHSESPGPVEITDENLRLLMEDPEFFLWVSNSYGALSQ